MKISIKSYPFTSILGWSASRYDTFNYCKRRYYYSYYAKFDQDIGKELIAKFKSMTSAALEVGIITHDIISAILQRVAKSTDPIDQNRLEAKVRMAVQETLRNKVMMEYFYGERSPIVFEELFEPVLQSVTNFLKSDRFAWALNLDDSLRKSWVIEPEGFGETRLGGLKAYCKVDFMLFDGQKVYVLDWKTGKPDALKYTRQMIGYSLYAKEVTGLDLDHIVPTLAFIRDSYQEVNVEVKETDTAKFQEQVESESQKMFDMTIDREGNIPRDKSEFPMTENYKRCKFCEFRRLCGQG